MEGTLCDGVEGTLCDGVEGTLCEGVERREQEHCSVSDGIDTMGYTDFCQGSTKGRHLRL